MKVSFILFLSCVVLQNLPERMVMSDYVSIDKQHPLKHALETSLKNRNVQRRVAYRIIFSALPEVKLMFERRTTFRK